MVRLQLHTSFELLPAGAFNPTMVRLQPYLMT